ncbi:Lipase- class 3 [Apiospora saccharicola]
MPRDRNDWNRRIRKLIGRFRSPAAGLPAASVPVLQTYDMGESTDSTSNSLATSQAVLRARTNLLYVLDEIDCEDSTSSGELVPGAAVVDYIRKVECYSNHKVCDALERCDITTAEWQKVCFAAHAAKDVHKMPKSPGQSTLVSGSRAGTSKIYSITQRTEDSGQYLIIAIRATRTAFDWTVNFNSDLVDFPEVRNDIKCHKGFLSVARNMRASIENAIREQTLPLDEPIQTILTGHSSGAAVAQLLFAILSAPDTANAETAVSSITKIDCITFGGPPVSVAPLHDSTNRRGGLFLNIVNEGDPVSLARPEYFDSLLKAYLEPPPSAAASWKVPPSTLHASGRQILLRDISEEGSDVEYPEAYWVDHRQLSLVIFGNPVRHSMTLYRNQVVEIRDRQE